MSNTKERRSLLSSQARIQAPWIKVTIGNYTFGVFDRKTKEREKNASGNYESYNITYPNYVQSLNIIKINGQINQYTLRIDYPVKFNDDPNFFEKVFSSVSNTRKIVFSYGDAATPSYVYKDEEAIITGVSQDFNLESGVISYTVNAVSSSVVGTTGSFTFISPGVEKPSKIIKDVFKNTNYGLRSLFKGMSNSNLDKLIAGDDRAIKIDTKTNISPLDYIIYLVSCMIPEGSTVNNISKDMYILTIHDETIFDKDFEESNSLGGAFFKVTKTSNNIKQADAYEVDIGYNNSTIVTQFSITNRENFALYYDYNSKLQPEQYTRRLNNQGQWEDVYAPIYTSGNDSFKTREEDIIWFTKMTKYPISATLKIQGLLRPAQLMQYLRLNVVFPGGNKHVSSGLYIITKQVDDISGSGYVTTLYLTKISD